ncbi:MAG: Nif11-like leader peptide family natural product precursor [Xenococcaceae cyanobacterium MO_167.B27]|nr:Nif11-like leader peptide family natural product precursor [Xenococcaceae cyanobacterium MO_167.B27]
MSQASVLEFIELAKVDNTLRSQLEAAYNSAEVKEIAAKKGYHFTEKEIVTVFQDQGLLTIQEEGELSEQELGTLAGGITVPIEFIYDC